ncbi:recombinase family protein [Candidatus Peregrinibacteria bacterium]|mgnify:CR=1 FL=1|jgi:site-specific DNA recombinase|nr:recombinase family protein [Candidatus Peregrinibacteria bacterium]MBT4148548.1 recombinase family protein [Candidatus Peregrinibacteria bacterium]MBT4456140.1 recombinase family protein [Candidatus Peregrinibacteria bacterium]
MTDTSESVTVKRCVIYLRKSEDDPKKQVRSIKDQKRECLMLAERSGMKVKNEDIIEEERSAKRSGNRSKFTKLIEDIRKRKIDGLIAWHPDRLARNMKEAGEIIDLLDEEILKVLKFVAHHYENDYNGKMALGINFVIAKQYSDKLSVDVKRGVVRALSEGKSSGQYKPGYIRSETTKYYEPNEEMCDNKMTMFGLLGKAWAMRIDGKTLEEIAEYMNINGYKRRLKKARKYQEISKQKLAKVFKDPFYYGVLMQAGQEVDLRGIYEFIPMVTEEEFLKVQHFNRPELEVPKKHKYPFKGLIVCNNCEKNLTAGAPRSRSGEKYLRYWCANKDCDNKSIRAKEVIEYMVALFDNLETVTKDHYEEYLKGAKEFIRKEEGSLLNEQCQLLKKQKFAEKEFEEIVVVLMTKGRGMQTNERKALENKKNKLSDSIKQYERRLEKLDRQLEKTIPMDFESFLNTLKTLSTSFLAADATTKDEIARNIFLNLGVKGGEIATVSVKEPFKSMAEKDFVLNGGPGWI